MPTTSKHDLTADLKTLNLISQTLNEAVNVQGALDDALSHLVELMELDTGWIFLRKSQDNDKWWGRGYVLAAHLNLPPALDLDSPEAWKGGCDCQGYCNTGKLDAAYNEVRCSRLSELTGDSRGLVVHASAPLRSREEVLGILNVAAPEWNDFSPRALSLLTNVGAQMGTALERARLFDLLRERRIREQAALLELSNQLLSRLELDDIMNFLVSKARQLLKVDAVSLLLVDEDTGILRFRAASGWHSDPVGEGWRLPTGEDSGGGRLSNYLQPWIFDNSNQEREFPDRTAKWLSAESFEAAAIVPLVADEKVIGALSINSREEHQFSEDELRFLELMANQAAIAIEKARLHEEELRRQRLEEDLIVGRQIQLGLLPKSCPTPPGWEFCDFYRAARQVGGDFYDFFELPGEPGRLGLVIADVSDKGVPAALFMGVSRTLIRSSALLGHSPSVALQVANDLIMKESVSDIFLSAFYGILHLGSGKLEYANAGHNPPLWYRSSAKEFRTLSADGVVLRVLQDITLEEKVVEISRDDVLVFYTDGVTEAMDGNLEEFGEIRLRTTVAAHADGSASQILDGVIEAVNAFTGAMDQHDDLTIFIAKRL